MPGTGAETVEAMATVSDEDVREQDALFGEPGTNGTPRATTPEEAAPAEKPAPETPTAPQAAVAAESSTLEGPELMANGLKFFSQLAQTLRDKEATTQLVNSITERDEATGQTYLKVPVENQKTVEDAITMLGTLFKALQ